MYRLARARVSRVCARTREVSRHCGLGNEWVRGAGAGSKVGVRQCPYLGCGRPVLVWCATCAPQPARPRQWRYVCHVHACAAFGPRGQTRATDAVTPRMCPRHAATGEGLHASLSGAAALRSGRAPAAACPPRLRPAAVVACLLRVGFPPPPCVRRVRPASTHPSRLLPSPLAAARRLAAWRGWAAKDCRGPAAPSRSRLCGHPAVCPASHARRAPCAVAHCQWG